MNTRPTIAAAAQHITAGSTVIDQSGSEPQIGCFGKFCTPEQAVAAIARGEIVVVVDDENRENEGDLIMAAECATEESVAFFVRHTSGVLCVAMTGEKLDHLAVPPMVAGTENGEAMGTAFTVSVDLRAGISTGISASDRAATVRMLADPAAAPTDFVRPGHVFPLRARPLGVLERPGHTEAAVDLVRLAGLPAAGLLAEVIRRDGKMARLPDLRQFCIEHGLLLASIGDLVRWRRRHERPIRRHSSARIPTEWGEFTAHAFRSSIDDVEHLALVRGELNGPEPVLARVHSECVTGDVFRSQRCDCGDQLSAALREIADAGRGVVVYLRGHEGRGIGIGHKLAAYQLQERGLDTVEANLALGLPVDAREYDVGAQILAELGVDSVRLMTGNPSKCAALQSYGITVAEQVVLPARVTPENRRYLQAKAERMGHVFTELETPLARA